MRSIVVAVLLALLLAGCLPGPESAVSSGIDLGVDLPSSSPAVVSSSSSSSLASSSSPVSGLAESEASQPSEPERPSYPRRVAAEIAARLSRPDSSEAERAQAAYEYIIENTSFAPPIGLDAWSFRGDKEPPSYLENRALSPLLFGIGSCEDYACALVLLLESMDIEARYVPGLTYSVEGILVDHAWTVARIDGIWYHLDSQLEDNILRQNQLRYRYFMKSDQTMLDSHRWGDNLIASGLLTAEQNDEIRSQFLYEPCPEDAPTPEVKQLRLVPEPNVPAILTELEQERRRYAQQHGSQPPVQLQIVPPVFGNEGHPRS